MEDQGNELPLAGAISKVKRAVTLLDSKSHISINNFKRCLPTTF